MARTRRAAAPKAALGAETSNANDHESSTRGRSRNTRSSMSRLSVSEQDTIQSANRSRDAALDRLANEDATTVPSSNTAEAADDTVSSVEVGRRATATPTRRDTTGLDLADDDVFGDLDESFADGEIPVPRSADTTRSWSSFKPRSRQSSFIGRNDPPIRPSSRGGNTPGIGSSFTIGAFRRRAREPSILGTTRRPCSETSAAGGQSDLESEADFAPEAESTPLHTRRRTRASLASQQNGTATIMGSSRLASRKRKSEHAHDDTARPGKSPRTNGDQSDSESELSELASPQPHASLPARPVTPVYDEEVMAPPMSSASEDEGEVWPDIHGLARKRRRPSVSTPGRGDAMSDISSPPSLTHSPNYQSSRSARLREKHTSRPHKSPRITSADLASLLPKRRYKKTKEPSEESSDEELDGSGLGKDDDELSHLEPRRSRRGTASRATSRATSRTGAGLSDAISNAKPTTRSSRRRTYGSRSSDKENQSEDEEDENDESAFKPLPDDTFDMAAEVAGQVESSVELKSAVKKFKEVDTWKLEYEEVAEEEGVADAR